MIKLTWLIFTWHALSFLSVGFVRLNFLHNSLCSFHLFLDVFCWNFSFFIFSTLNFCAGQCLCEFETSLSLILYDTHSLLVYNNKIYYVSINMWAADKKPNFETMNWMEREREWDSEKEKIATGKQRTEIKTFSKKWKKSLKKGWQKQVSL